MTLGEAYSQLLNVSEPSYFRLKKKYKSLFQLLDRYFLPEDIVEFRKTNSILKFDSQSFALKEIKEINAHKYLQIFLLNKPDDSFLIFYFNFLNELRKSQNQEVTIDTLLFNSSFYLVDPVRLANTYLIAFTFDNNLQVMINKNFKIQSYFTIFKEWDSYMLLFLRECIQCDFLLLFEKNGALKQNSVAIFHIIAYSIFSDSKYQKIPDNQKIEICHKSHKIAKDSFGIGEKMTKDDIYKIIATVIS